MIQNKPKSIEAHELLGSQPLYHRLDCLAQVSGHPFWCFPLISMVADIWVVGYQIMLFRNLAEVVWLAPNHVSCPILFACSFPDTLFLVLYTSQLGTHCEVSTHYRKSKWSHPSPTTIISPHSSELTVLNSLLSSFEMIFCVFSCSYNVTLTLRDRVCVPSPGIWAGLWQ